MLQSVTSWQDRLNPLAEVEFSAVQRNKVREGRGQENPLCVEKVNYDYEDYTAELLQNQANDMSVRGGRQMSNERLGKCQLPPGAWSQWSVVTHNV